MGESLYVWYSEASVPNVTQLSVTGWLAVGLLYMLHKGYCDGAFPMHDEAGDNDPGKKEILEMIWSRYDQDDPADRPWSAASTVGSGEDARHELDRTWAKSCRFQPLWKIRNYFGEKIALYFAWSGTLIISLWPPMLFGFAVFLYGLYLRSGTTTRSVLVLMLLI